MKVLTIGTDKKIFDTGSKVFARTAEYAARTEEWHVIVFTTHSDKLFSFEQKNIYIHATNSSSRYIAIWDAFLLGKKILKTHGFTKENGVITSQEPFLSSIPAYLLKLISGIRLQIQIHTDFLSPYFKTTFLNRIRYMIACFLVPRADSLRVVSKQIKDSLQNRFKLKTVPNVLPIFVPVTDLAKQTPLTNIRELFPQFKKIILMASRLTEEKQIHVALHACAEVVRIIPDAGLIVCGDGEEKKKLEIVADQLGISEHVVFVGWQDDLVSYYKGADVFLLTSKYEGYGMTLIEAGACGIPIVTTPVGIAGELCVDGQNAFVCPVGDTLCFTEKITRLLQDYEVGELFKTKMRDSILENTLSLDEYIEKYIRLLDETRTHYSQ